MSEINFPDPQGYDAESFGTSGSPLPDMREQKRGWGGSSFFVIACGGCAVLFVLVCACCGIGSYFGGRADVGQALLWAGALQQRNYDVAELIVCEDSQAEDYTLELIAADAVLTSYDFGDGSSATRIEGAMDIGGESTVWSARFVTNSGGNLGGGLFGRCIDEIIVDE